MKEIVDQVLKEEEMARQSVQKARDEADRMVLEAQKESGRLMEEKINSSRESGLKKKEEAERSFLSEKKKILEEAREKNLQWRKKQEADIDRLTQKVLQRIITTEK